MDAIPFKMAYENKATMIYLAQEMKREPGNLNIFN